MSATAISTASAQATFRTARLAWAVALGLLLALGLGGGAMPTAHATVYDLLPDTGIKAVRDAVRARTVMTEALEINGRKGTMDVSLGGLDWDATVKALMPLVARAGQGAGGRSLLLEGTPVGGVVTRYLVLSVGEKYETVLFTMDVPVAPDLQDMRQFWPTALPAPIGVKVEMVANFTARGGIYMLYESYTAGEQAFSAYDGQLRAAGWRSLASDRTANATYISEDQTHLLFFATDERDSGTRGSVYVRRVK